MMLRVDVFFHGSAQKLMSHSRGNAADLQAHRWIEMDGSMGEAVKTK